MQCHGRGKIAAHAARYKARLREECGQSLILLAVAMFVFLAVGAFAIDIAQMSVAHHQAQVAADAAALSAAQDMETSTTVMPTTTVQQDGTTAATSNYPGSTVTISQPTSLQAKAQVSAGVSLPFGRMFGFGTGTVSAQAVAQVNTAQANVNGTVLAIDCPNDEYSPCTYNANGTIPTGDVQNGQTGWQVTKVAEDPTTNGSPSPAGIATVNIQTCDGTGGSGQCYNPGSSTPQPKTQQQNIQVVDLNGQSEGGMWETVPTVPYAHYVLNFWLTGNPALNGWPNATNNSFPVDVYITDGTSQYTPSIATANNSTTNSGTNVCNAAPQPSGYLACGWYNYHDPVCTSAGTATTADGVTLTCSTAGQEEAYFTEESLAFVAGSSGSTTITFNSETFDNNINNWFNCGPEVANIVMGYPAIQLVQ